MSGDARRQVPPPSGSPARERAEVGAAIRSARLAAGLTQTELGACCGFSASTISRLESGRSRLDDITVRRVIAEALSMPFAGVGLASTETRLSSDGQVAQVGGRQVARVSPDRGADRLGDEHVRRRELIASLASVAMLGALPASGRGSVKEPSAVQLEALLNSVHRMEYVPRSPDELETTFAAVRSAFVNCRYADVASTLPELLAAAHVTCDATFGEKKDRASEVLANAYMLASELCVKRDEGALAWVLADRALNSAQHIGSPAIIASASRSVAIAMRRHGHYEGATSLLTSTALKLGADSGEPEPRILGSYGSLLCTAAYSSAQNGSRTQAVELLDEAESAARRLARLGVEVPDFNTANVRVYRIGVSNALGDSAAALQSANSVDTHFLRTPERQARFCIDTARSWYMHGDRQRSFLALRTAERSVPEELRRPSVRLLVSTLLHAPGAPVSGLREFATRIRAIT
jgi:transcriptional regulator with XRE-family HTH domain